MSEIDRESFEKAVASGNESLRNGEPAMAALHFQRALDMDNGNAKILAVLGLALFRANQFVEARPVYQALVSRHPNDASHRLNLGLVHLKLGDADAAINMLEASRQIDPSSGRAVSYLGLAYARAGKFAQAYKSFLLAGQSDLAEEVAENLSAQERSAIVATVPKRSGSGITEPPPMAQAADDAIPREQQDASESIRFVLQQENRQVMAEVANNTAVSRAVAKALPAAAAAKSQLTAPLDDARGSAGLLGGGPTPLSTFATTDLVDFAGYTSQEANTVFASGKGTLCVRVSDRMWSRNEGVVVHSGGLTFEPANRRIRGQQSQEPFMCGSQRMMSVSGSGYFIAMPAAKQVFVVALDDDILYLRDDLVFAFEPTLRWENGNVPGLRGQLGVVQFRGDGAVAFASKHEVLRIKLLANQPCFIATSQLAGWIGRVVPRAATVEGVSMVECSGEGVVLLETTEHAAA